MTLIYNSLISRKDILIPFRTLRLRSNIDVSADERLTWVKADQERTPISVGKISLLGDSSFLSQNQILVYFSKDCKLSNFVATWTKLSALNEIGSHSHYYTQAARSVGRDKFQILSDGNKKDVKGSIDKRTKPPMNKQGQSIFLYQYKHLKN